ncbi:sugar MFS transporter [Pararcticibacter amylolyticus]|uniref:Glucose/galactose MFS transporter n=1 Tax=Pararcticibacter amylolyticus TaxID=2173175 RepID=A0A2U2PJT5_9SPHI|nr:sugar MFS transporter [Pararcticibacter amylolyticus]PWG81522.1 glucose/galactose MFS transporter [Pararcticibacter amylolyticus]
MANIPLQNVASPEEASGDGRNYTPALMSLAVLYFMMGLLTCLNDTLVPFFKKGFTLSYAESSLVQFYFFLTYAVMSVPAGKIVERIGYKNGMVAGFSIAALGALLFYPASVIHQYYLFLAALFVLAVGIVLLQVAANPYITILGPAQTASSRLTLIQGIGSLGTTAAPVFGAHFILSRLDVTGSSSAAVRYPYLGIALVLLVIAFAVKSLSLPRLKSGGTGGREQEVNVRNVLKFRNLKFGIAGLFFYVGAEVAVGTFLTNYISEKLHIGESEANGYVAFYWGGMMAGRFLGSWLLKFLRPQAVLCCCTCAAMALILLSVNSGSIIAVWTMIGVGLCNSVMFAIIFSLAINGLGEYSTLGSGMLSTAIAGGAVISYLQGYLIDHYSWQLSFTLPVICYGYILFYAVNGYKAKSKEAADLSPAFIKTEL